MEAELSVDAVVIMAWLLTLLKMLIQQCKALITWVSTCTRSTPAGKESPPRKIKEDLKEPKSLVELSAESDVEDVKAI
jgi:hypothetical protein